MACGGLDDLLELVAIPLEVPNLLRVYKFAK
jgi:hypothetical protein